MTPEEHKLDLPETIEMPAPTAWPILLALGLTTSAAGFVTTPALTILGLSLAVVSAIGWFRAVLPHAAREFLPIEPETAIIETHRPHVDRHAETLSRAALPVETYPISAGVKGGLAGSIAMAILAMTYGFLSHNSIWYPINLLVAGFFPSSVMESVQQLVTFNLSALLIAIPLHLLFSLMVGLLYGAALPMLPRNPILLGGFIAPLMWSGLIYAVLGIVDPVLNQRIDWMWFVISQIGFGVVAGLVVSRAHRIRTSQPVSRFRL